MKIINNLNFIRSEKKTVATAMGTFDGLHKGHRQIIKKQKKIAQNTNLATGIYSFYPHPLRIVNPDNAPGYLLSEKQKVNIVKNLKLDYLFQQKFTSDFAKIKFDKFIKNILLNQLDCKYIVVGEDFRFGYQGNGNINSLKKLAKKCNFKVEIVKPLIIEGKVVSSSYIRKLIKKGKVTKVSKFLGNNFEIKGKVIKGEGRGKKLGYPTANLKLNTDYVLPPAGVYAGFVHYNDCIYKGIGYFGYKPTFSKKNYNIEIHIFNFSDNIYGEKLNFELVKYIRKDLCFENETDLINQIQNDILYTERLLC